jgi:ATP-dependent protease ClpP protease subunit
MVMPQTPQQPAYVNFSAEVTEKSIQGLLNIMTNCANAHFADVHLLLSTQGGSVMHGINAYNVLSGMPFNLTTHNVGNVDSIGNAIFLAGATRYACPHSTFMFHGVAYSGGNQIFDAKIAQIRLDGLKADQKRIGTIITSRTNLSKSKVDGFFRAQKVLTAQDALTEGVIHNIQDVDIPAGATVATLVVT